MGTDETQAWYVFFTKKNPQPRLDDLFGDFRSTFMSVREQLSSGSLARLDKCKQGKDEPIKSFNIRFLTLNRQYHDATTQGHGVYDEVGVRNAYLKNLFLPDIAREVHQQNSLENMMSKALQCSLPLYKLYWTRHGDESSDTNDETSDQTDSSSDEDDPPEKTTRDKSLKKNMSDDQGKQKSKSTTVANLKTNQPASAKNNTTSKDVVSKDDFESLSKEMERLKILISKGNRATPRPAGPPTTRYSGEKSRTADVQCFNCQQFGHYARDCLTPKSAQTLMVEAMIQEQDVGDEDFNVRCYRFGFVDVEMDF